MSEPIYLHLEIIDGKKHVFDQHAIYMEARYSFMRSALPRKRHARLGGR